MHNEINNQIVDPGIKPHVVPDYLWLRIPDQERARYRKSMAFSVIFGVHPRDSIAKMLVEDGIYPTIDLALEEPPMSASDATSADVRDDAAIAPSGEEPEIRMPHWPYGAAGYSLGAAPISKIGDLLVSNHGVEPEDAAKYEYNILKAIAADPCFVLDNPENLLALKCLLRDEYIQSLREHIIRECTLVIDDVRQRKADGDSSAALWFELSDIGF